MRAPKFILALLGVLAAASASAADNEFVEDPSPLSIKLDGRTFKLEALVIRRADAKGRLPIAIIAHGKPPLREQMLKAHPTMYLHQMQDLARRGWLAVTVMRRGYGSSAGSAVQLTCESHSFLGAMRSDADEIDAALDVIADREDADPERILAIGISAGGMAVSTLSARPTKGLRAVVNISGGRRFRQCDREDLLVSAFGAIGKGSRIPNLWLYAENDTYFPPRVVKRMHKAFEDGGGEAKLVMLEPLRGEGHFVFGRPDGRGQMLPQLDGFLRKHDLPTWNENDADAVMEKLNAREASRPFVIKYLGGPSERALAHQKSGTYMHFVWGAKTLEQARTRALERCEEKSHPCEIVMENDRWVAGAR